MKDSASAKTTLRLTQIALLIAVTVIFAFTPLGFLKIGPFSLTFVTVPVILGAALLGVGGGAILGFTFGMCSFIQCFGMDALGVLLLEENPVFTFVMCVLPRVLVGVVAALVFRFFPKRGNLSEICAYAVSSALGSLTNTVLFVGMLLLFFFGTDALSAGLGLGTDAGGDIGAVLTTLVTFNALVELAVNTFIVTLLAKSLTAFFHRMNRGRHPHI